MLVDSGIRILKYYLDISRDEQKTRLNKRREDPLKQWKLSAIDDKAVSMWQEYTAARDDMLQRTNATVAPWYVIDADNKRAARISVIKHVLASFNYQDKDQAVAAPDPAIIRAASL